MTKEIRALLIMLILFVMILIDMCNHNKYKQDLKRNQRDTTKVVKDEIIKRI